MCPAWAGARALENESETLDSTVTLPHLLPEWPKATCSLRPRVNRIIIPSHVAAIRGSDTDSASLGVGLPKREDTRRSAYQPPTSRQVETSITHVMHTRTHRLRSECNLE